MFNKLNTNPLSINNKDNIINKGIFYANAEKTAQEQKKKKEQKKYLKK